MDSRINKEIDSIVESKMTQYGNCAQASFSSLKELLKLEEESQYLLKALYPFPGIGMTFGTCGAVSGSLCIIGMLYGIIPQNYQEKSEKAAKCMSIARKLCSKIEQEYGSKECGEIMTKLYGKRFDLLDNEEMKAFLDANTSDSNCTNVVKFAVKTTFNLLSEE